MFACLFVVVLFRVPLMLQSVCRCIGWLLNWLVIARVLSLTLLVRMLRMAGIGEYLAGLGGSDASDASDWLVG